MGTTTADINTPAAAVTVKSEKYLGVTIQEIFK